MARKVLFLKSGLPLRNGFGVENHGCKDQAERRDISLYLRPLDEDSWYTARAGPWILYKGLLRKEINKYIIHLFTSHQALVGPRWMPRLVILK